MSKAIFQIAKHIVKNIDLYVTIAVAAYATYLSAIGGRIEYAIAAIAAAISITALSQFRERTERVQVGQSIQAIDSTAKKILGDLTADEIFSSASSEESYVTSAHKNILMIQETGQLLAERLREQLLSFLRNGGDLKVVLVLNTECVTHLMAYRNMQLHSRNLMSKRMENGLNTFEVLRKEAGTYAENIEIRFIEYPIDFTAVLSDPYSNNMKGKKGLIRLQGFKVPFNDKLDFKIDASLSRNTYAAYLSQADRMWKLANRCNLLTGPSRIGKSTALQRLLDKISNDSQFNSKHGFITEAVLDGQGERIGFDVKVIGKNEKSRIASKTSPGVYELDDSVMSSVIIPELQIGAKLTEGIFFVDEIGLFQVRSKAFRDAVDSLINNRFISIFGVISNEPNQYFSHIKNHLRVGTIQVNASNREEIAEVLYQEIRQ